MNKEITLTGDKQAVKLHLGHHFGSLRNRIILQYSTQYQQYVMIANWQTLTDNADNITKMIQ